MVGPTGPEQLEELDSRARHGLRLTDHSAAGTVRPESGLTDDDFSPIWANDDRPRIPGVAAEHDAHLIT